MFVMDMASMSLPEPDTTPTPIPLTVIYGVNRDGYWPGESPRATAMSNGAFYELVPLHGSNERVYRAAAQRDIMMAPWKDWWSDTNCPDFVTVPDPRQPYCEQEEREGMLTEQMASESSSLAQNPGAPHLGTGGTGWRNGAVGRSSSPCIATSMGQGKLLSSGRDGPQTRCGTASSRHQVRTTLSAETTLIHAFVTRYR